MDKVRIVDIKAIKAKKSELENNILDLLMNFQSETETRVIDIKIATVPSYPIGGNLFSVITKIHVNIEI